MCSIGWYLAVRLSVSYISALLVGSAPALGEMPVIVRFDAKIWITISIPEVLWGEEF
jgi:hypothetical protein